MLSIQKSRHSERNLGSDVTDNLYSNILAIMIIAMSIAMAVINIRFYRSCYCQWRWIKLCYGLIGVMYSVFYTLYLMGLIDVGIPHTRSMTTITVAILLSGSIVTLRSRGRGCA